MYDDSVNYRHTSNNKAVTCPRGLNAAWKDLLLNEIQIFENFVTVYNIYCDYTNVYICFLSITLWKVKLNSLDLYQELIFISDNYRTTHIKTHTLWYGSKHNFLSYLLSKDFQKLTPINVFWLVHPIESWRKPLRYKAALDTFTYLYNF